MTVPTLPTYFLYPLVNARQPLRIQVTAIGTNLELGFTVGVIPPASGPIRHIGLFNFDFPTGDNPRYTPEPVQPHSRPEIIPASHTTYITHCAQVLKLSVRLYNVQDIPTVQCVISFANSDQYLATVSVPLCNPLHNYFFARA